MKASFMELSSSQTIGIKIEPESEAESILLSQFDSFTSNPKYTICKHNSEIGQEGIKSVLIGYKMIPKKETDNVLCGDTYTVGVDAETGAVDWKKELEDE